MIGWRTIAEMPDELLDGREVLLAVPNTLGTADGGDGERLNPADPYIYDIARFVPDLGGRWQTNRDDCGGCFEWEREAPSHFAELTPPGTVHMYRQSGGQLAEALRQMREHGQPFPGEEPWRFR
jgi:hypothetical protein